MPTELPPGRRPARAPLSALALALACAAAPGCERDAPPETYRQAVEAKDVPEGVMKAAKKVLPDVTFQDAFKNLRTGDQSLHSYELRGRTAQGKIREVRVSTDGRVLEME